MDAYDRGELNVHDYIAFSMPPITKIPKEKVDAIVDDFVKKSQYTYYTEEALGKVAESIAFFAGKEGLDAHAKSVTVRFEGEKK